MPNAPSKKSPPGRPVQLRRPSPSDMRYIRSLWADPVTMESVGGPIYLTEGQSAKWFRRVVDPGSPGDCYRLICDEGGSPVGEISYHRMDFSTMTAEFNVKIEDQFREEGFAGSAMREFLDFYFTEMDGRVLIDEVASGNLAGQHLLESFGFEPTVEPQLSRRFVMTRERFMELYPPGSRDRDKEA